MTLSQDEQKTLVGTKSIDLLIERGLLFSNMKIGLGTGSTVMPAINQVAKRIADGTLTGIKAVATSFQTTIACENYGIPIYSLNAKEIAGSLDLAIDGADEISPNKMLIKGGGAALLLEKIIGYNAKHYVIIADSSKLVAHLGTQFSLPIEVIAEARVCVTKQLEKLGACVTIRQAIRKAGPIITDNGNLILDVLWKKPIDPQQMEDIINGIVGVVENGLFTKNIPLVFYASLEGTVLEK